MRPLIPFLALTVLSLTATSVPAEAESPYAWPGGQRAAINLAYDDALPTQLDVAIPQLDQHGLKGSFYVVPSAETMRLRLDDWRAAAANGHELGNHTLFHACRSSLPNREWVQPWADLDSMSVDELRARLVVANTFLYAVDGRTARTYTATCFDDRAGGEPYLDAVADLFIGIKAGTADGQGVTDMAKLDSSRVPVVAPVGLTGEQLIAVAREAAERGTMANYTFHGVGGDHLSVTPQAHEALLRHLADHPDIYWVDTFENIMTWVNRGQGE